jgi:hypothetical protein
MRVDSNGGFEPQYTLNWYINDAPLFNGSFNQLCFVCLFVLFVMQRANNPTPGDPTQERNPVHVSGYITRGRAYRGKAATGTPSQDMDPDEEYRQVIPDNTWLSPLPSPSCVIYLCASIHPSVHIPIRYVNYTVVSWMIHNGITYISTLQTNLR